jgi:RNA polymerase sporulation-specific sigma factor
MGGSIATTGEGDGMTSKERERFISENIKLVSFAVKPFVPLGKTVGLDFDDLFSIGCIGLVKSVDYFDASRGVKFSTYAVPMIRGYVLQQLWRNVSCLRFSARYKEAWWTIKRNGLEDAAPEEIQQQLQMDAETIEGAFAYGDKTRIHSLDWSTEVIDSKRDVALHDFLGVNEDFSNVVVDDFLARLNEREKHVVRGILVGKSQVEIGKEIGVTQSVVSKLRNRIAGKLKDYLELAM